MPTREELLRREYCARMERVIDYIYAHYGEALDMGALADVAAFSRFHFHRMFSGVVGETVGDFIKRTRLERAASRLADNPLESVTDVAMNCGFSSPSVFSRAFRERFSMSASEWRRSRSRGAPPERNVDQALGKNRNDESKGWNAKSGSAEYIPPIAMETRRFTMSRLDFTVEVKDLPELNVAYVRHIGPYNGIGKAFEELGRWRALAGSSLFRARRLSRSITTAPG